MDDTTSRYYIHRRENKATPDSWVVKLHLTEGRRGTLSKHFTDARYKGKELALAAAQAFRDERMGTLGITRRKSVSGHYSVRLFRQYNGSGVLTSVSWLALFPVDGHSGTKSFSLKDYGYEDAWRLAMEERVKHGGLPPPKAPPPMPGWVREWLLSSPVLTYRGTFGHIGVNLTRPIQNGKQYMFWKAEWIIAGQGMSKCWSVRKYGYAGAWRLAAEERARHDGLPTPIAPPPMPDDVKEWLASTPAKKSGRTGIHLVSARRNEKSYPFWAALWFSVAGQRKIKSWSIIKYGYEDAWRLAVAWREEHDGLPSPQVPPPMPEWVREQMTSIQAKPRRNNTSGRVGVRLMPYSKRNGKRYPSWIAWFLVAGRQKVKQWSIIKYGYEDAWRLAVAWREEHDGLPSPQYPPPMPEWVKELTESKSIREHKKEAHHEHL